MPLWTAIIVTFLASAYIVFLYGANKWTLVIDGNLIGAGILVAAAWLVWWFWR
jgi:hypothetical protein